MTLTTTARTALTNALPRQGAPVTAEPATLRELLDSGLVSANGNLTRRGVTARERVIDDALNAAFNS